MTEASSWAGIAITKRVDGHVAGTGGSGTRRAATANISQYPIDSMTTNRARNETTVIITIISSGLKCTTLG
jgi:hypothetical protein